MLLCLFMYISQFLQQSFTIYQRTIKEEIFEKSPGTDMNFISRTKQYQHKRSPKVFIKKTKEKKMKRKTPFSLRHLIMFIYISFILVFKEFKSF